MEDKTPKFYPSEKVVYIPNGKTYDFGYFGQTGLAIIYEEGECNMQDATAVKPNLLERLVEK